MQFHGEFHTSERSEQEICLIQQQKSLTCGLHCDLDFCVFKFFVRPEGVQQFPVQQKGTFTCSTHEETDLKHLTFNRGCAALQCDAVRCAPPLRCARLPCAAMRRGALRYHVFQCGTECAAARRPAARCDAMRCAATRCGALRFGIVRCISSR